MKSLISHLFVFALLAALVLWGSGLLQASPPILSDTLESRGDIGNGTKAYLNYEVSGGTLIGREVDQEYAYNMVVYRARAKVGETISLTADSRREQVAFSDSAYGYEPTRLKVYIGYGESWDETEDIWRERSMEFSGTKGDPISVSYEVKDFEAGRSIAAYAYMSFGYHAPGVSQALMSECIVQVIFDIDSEASGNVTDSSGEEATVSRRFIRMTLEEPLMIVDEQLKEIDPGMGTGPVMLGDRVVVPIRAIVEEMGGEVSFDSLSRVVMIDCRGVRIEMTLDELEISVDGVVKQMDVAPVSINGRTMLPIRFVGENLGCSVEWLSDSRQVIIGYDDARVG